ncbi:hypothetical protein [Desulfuromonas sp. AOP6]|uniref:hypothetical protein n=1 Tax=Desulfuromonas sp. AOP6 TaxID=1566351 RepID=UPI00127A6D6E|nr:hypothetical protein [Desulfuromonas sp. AOP6]BCA80819.1 hypothetical protein AOP6_2606 [Desulfuromonas sp. AOP6]
MVPIISRMTGVFFFGVLALLLSLVTAAAVSAEDYDIPLAETFPGLYLESKGNLTGLSYTADSNVTSFFGASFQLEDSIAEDDIFIPDGSSLYLEEKQNYFLGAAIDCCIGQDTRLTLNYQWNPKNVPGFMDGVSNGVDTLDESYNISFGLSMAF